MPRPRRIAAEKCKRKMKRDVEILQSTSTDLRVIYEEYINEFSKQQESRIADQETLSEFEESNKGIFGGLLEAVVAQAFKLKRRAQAWFRFSRPVVRDATRQSCALYRVVMMQ